MYQKVYFSKQNVLKFDHVLKNKLFLKGDMKFKLRILHYFLKPKKCPKSNEPHPNKGLYHNLFNV